MLLSMSIKEVMSTRLITLHPKDKMSRVKEIFEDFSIHHIPVVVSGELVGILSKTDFNLMSHIAKNSYDRFVQDKMMKSETVDQYMNKEIYAMTPENTIGEAIEIFLENRIHCLPIVDGYEIVGIVTPYDVLKFINKLK